mgnify:FL=1|jgi:predicted MFS family arabinose efflux permease
MGNRPRSIAGFVANAVTMAFVAGTALVLLLYVGYGEATRTLQQFQVEKLASQGRYLQSTMNDFLQPGHPIKQFVGFNAKSGNILASDHTIGAIAVYDNLNRPVFTNGPLGGALLQGEPGATTAGSHDGFLVRDNEEIVQVLLPLNNRFEQVGVITFTMNKSIVTDRVQDGFEPIMLAALLAAIAFGIATSVLGADMAIRKRWLHAMFATCFIGVSGLVVATLVTLYAEGAQAKSKSMADTLGQRLANIVAFGLNIWEIDGIDDLLQDYRALNPDMAHASIIVDDIVRFHTDRSAAGKAWTSNPDHYEYISDMSQPGGRNIKLAVAIPSDIVMRQSIRSIKNFAALFIASALMASVFLQIAGSMRRLGGGDRASREDDDADPADGRSDVALLNLVKPVFFIAVATEHLSYAFLPQYITQLADKLGLASEYASAPFTIYYLLFALSLIPAGHLSQRVGAKPMMFAGLALSGVGLYLLATAPDFALICLARALSGIGQGILFIGVQSYILDVASPERKTRGAAIIVYGFQGGMITGMAIGSLLVTHIGQESLFNVAACVAFVMAVYTLIVVPGKRMSATTVQEPPPSFRLMARDLSAVFRDLEFMRTMLLVGVPTKAVLTGVVIFALPLLLSSGGFRQEDIGQVLMIYAACVLVSSGYISGFVDRTKRTDDVLLVGSFLSAIALIAIGVFGPSGAALASGGNAQMAIIAIILAVALLGLAHGLVNAPVVTHVASTFTARKNGAATVTATYRFLERIGHVAGPVVVGQLMATGIATGKSIAWIGVAILIMAALFALKPRQKFHESEVSGS